MVAKGTFHDEFFFRVDITLYDKVNIRRDFQLIRQTPDQVYSLFPQESRKHIFVHVFGQGSCCCIGISRVAAKGNCHRHPFPEFPVFREMMSRSFVPVPVHAGKGRAEYLHAVHAEVADACNWIPGMNYRQRDERPAVGRPAGENRKLRKVGSFHDYLLATAFFPYRPWKPG